MPNLIERLDALSEAPGKLGDLLMDAYRDGTLREALRDAGRLDHLDSLTKRRYRCPRRGSKITNDGFQIASDMHFNAFGVTLYVRTGIGSDSESVGHGATTREAIDTAIDQERGDRLGRDGGKSQ